MIDWPSHTLGVATMFGIILVSACTLMHVYIFWRAGEILRVTLLGKDTGDAFSHGRLPPTLRQ